MKRYTPTLEAFSWANSEDCDTEVMPVMAETPDGAYVKRDEAEAECERLRRENARLQRKANELPGLTATLDEYAHFARLVGECLTQHDESNGCVTGVKQPDGPITARVRAALAGLSPIPERPGDEHPPAPVEDPEEGAR